MIYTCTTNPSLDYYINVPELNKGTDNRSESESYGAGGKGVNVSIVLSNFRIPSTALGFLGGFTKDYYLSFIDRYPNIQPLFTTIEGDTRINVKLMGKDCETGLNARGPAISEEEFDRFRNRLSRIYTDDVFVLSGNIQKEIEDKMIAIVKELNSQGVRIVLDSTYEVIQKCVTDSLFMVKISPSVVQASGLSIDELMNELISKGVRHVLYSADDEASYLYTHNGRYRCSFSRDMSVSYTGSSDAMVAGFLYANIRGADDFECFRYANAAAMATTLSNDMGSKEKIEDLYERVEVCKI